MNYLPPLLAVLCFGPWITAREVYHRYTKHSTAEESSIKPNQADTRFPMINGFIQAASQAKTWIQWLRKLLKALRKWCASHPQEVKLGKCFAKYFNIKIPGLRHHEKVVRDNEDVKQSEKLNSGREIFCQSQGRIFGENSPRKTNTSLIWDTATRLGNRFLQYRDILFGNELSVCAWDYFWKKFWGWIDSAPDH